MKVSRLVTVIIEQKFTKFFKIKNQLFPLKKHITDNIMQQIFPKKISIPLLITHFHEQSSCFPQADHISHIIFTQQLINVELLAHVV